MGTLKSIEPYGKPQNYTTHCIFVWNILTDSFEVIEPPEDFLLQPPSYNYQVPPNLEIPKTNCNGVLVMDYSYSKTKTSLRDYNNYLEICLTTDFLTSDYSDNSNSDSD